MGLQTWHHQAGAKRPKGGNQGRWKDLGCAPRQNGYVTWGKPSHLSCSICKQNCCYHSGLKQNSIQIPQHSTWHTVSPQRKWAPNSLPWFVTLNDVLIKSQSSPKLPSDYSGLQPPVTSPLSAPLRDYISPCLKCHHMCVHPWAQHSASPTEKSMPLAIPTKGHCESNTFLWPGGSCALGSEGRSELGQGSRIIRDVSRITVTAKKWRQPECPLRGIVKSTKAQPL